MVLSVQVFHIRNKSGITVSNSSTFRALVLNFPLLSLSSSLSRASWVIYRDQGPLTDLENLSAMASILQRLARMEEELSLQGSQPDDPKTEVPPDIGEKGKEGSPGWKSVKREPPKRTELNQTVASKVPLSSLVWGRCDQLKGGSAMLPGRVCDPSEAVADPLIKFPIPENLVLVEFFNLPVRLGRFYLLEPRHILPFNEGGGEGWSDKYEARLLEVWRRKYDISTANRVHSASMQTAREFLRLSLTKVDFSGAEDHSASKASSSSPLEPVDVEKFRLKNTSNSRGERFEAGDWVQYEHIVLKCTMQSRVIEVTDDPRMPLVLENGDALDMHQVVVRIPALEAADIYDGRIRIRDDFECQLLSQFKFFRSKIENAESLHDSLRKEGVRCRNRFERETGMLLQYKKGRGKASKDVQSLSPETVGSTAKKRNNTSFGSAGRTSRASEGVYSPEDEGFEQEPVSLEKTGKRVKKTNNISSGSAGKNVPASKGIYSPEDEGFVRESSSFEKAGSGKKRTNTSYGPVDPRLRETESIFPSEAKILTQENSFSNKGDSTTKRSEIASPHSKRNRANVSKSVYSPKGAGIEMESSAPKCNSSSSTGKNNSGSVIFSLEDDGLDLESPTPKRRR